MTRTWVIGPAFSIRHAGMPFDWLEDLGASPSLLQAAEQVLSAEDAVREVGGRIGLPAGSIEQALGTAQPGALPGSRSGRWRQAVADWRLRLDAYHAAFEVDSGRAREKLGAVLGRTEVQEAVLLSTPEVYHNMLMPYLAAGTTGPLNARTRRAQRQLYTFLQRFCAKNETVSFFGPMGYGNAVPGDQVTLLTGKPRRRKVFLAAWAARELAAAVAADRRLITRLPFRRTGLSAPPHTDPRAEALLAAVGPDGAALPALAKAIGQEVRETARLLRPLVACGALVFGVAADPYDLDPLAAMIADLAALPQSPVISQWILGLKDLAGLVDQFERAALPERIELIDRMEAAFTTLTGVQARRGQGTVYADRAIFYEECSSPFALEVGEQVLKNWQRKLTGALELSAAHGWETWVQARKQSASLLDEGSELTLIEYAEKLRPAFDPGGSSFSPDHMPVHRAENAPRVIERLLSLAGELPGDRYALIDLCPAATDAASIGMADLVLSRCHHHLLTDGWLATMAENPDVFGQAAAEWAAGHPETVGLDLGRRNKGYYLYPGRRLVLRAPAAADARGAESVWPQEVTVAKHEGQLECASRDGSALTVYLTLADYVKYPPFAALSHPQVLHAAFSGESSTPQISVGEVIYQRARWSPDPSGFTVGSPGARFLSLRRLARQCGGWRFVFCRTDRERKPYLIDLESVLAADLLAHICIDASTLTAEQMLPAPEDLWLRDEEGHRYTCELRMQVIGKENPGKGNP